MAVVSAPDLTVAAPSGDPSQYYLTIERQPLGTALQELAKQSGVQIIFFSQIAEGLQAPALQGQFTVPGALQVLLARSKLTFRVINSHTVEVRLSEAETTPADSDTGVENGRQPTSHAAVRSDLAKKTPVGDPNSLDEVVVNGTAEGLVATRTQTPVREIPQTISLISHEQIRQQNDSDLADALGNAVGITVLQNNSLDATFLSRGFTITTFHLDGGAALNAFSNTPIYGTPDLGEFDHVEILRGADALFGGLGNPGATVNLIRKRPLSTSEEQFIAYAGSWSNFRGEADITGPLGFDGALRGRLDVVFGDKDYFFNTASLERKKIFGVLEWDLASRTLLTVGGSYQWTNAVPFSNGWPDYADGGDAHLPRSLALTFNWSRYDTQTRELYAQLQQSFGDDWKLKLNATSLDAAAEYGYGEFDSPIDPVTKALPVLPYAFFSPSPNTQDQFVVDATVTDSFELFGRRIDFAVGGDYTHFAGNIPVELINTFEPAVSNVFSFDPATYPKAPVPSPPLYRSQAVTNQSGEFASARVYLTSALSMVAGARVSSNRSSNTVSLSILGFDDSFTQSAKDADKVTPFVGVTYDLTAHYSLYASYADIYQTNDGERRSDGSLLSPADGVDRELGIKSSWRDNTLNGLAVVYEIGQRGLGVYDTSASNVEQRSLSSCCYLPDGTNKSKGFDAELSGTLIPGWLIGAGYTFNINHAFAGGALSTETPRHLVKAWTSAQLPGSLQRWTVGGSVQAQSSNFDGGFECPQPTPQGNCMVTEQYVRNVQGSYALVGVRAGYQINAHWRAALSINNVFDRIYYQTIGLSVGGNWYGEPRSFILRLDGKY